MDRARLLARVFSRGAAEPTRSDVDVAWELLGDLRDRARWLVCSCRPEAPLLFPRRKQTRMELVRHPAQAHALECPFHAVRSVARGACASRGFEVVLRAKDLTAPATLAGRLARLLAEVIARSGVAMVSGDEVTRRIKHEGRSFQWADVAARYKSLWEATASLPRHTGTWGEWSVHHVNGVPSLRSRLHRAPAQVVPAHGLFVGQVDRLGEGRKAWVVEAAADRPVWFTSAARLAEDDAGPYLGAGVIAVAAERKVRGIVGAAVPVYSSRLLMPVSGPIERAVLTVLLEQLVYWHEKRGCTVRLERPAGPLPEAGVKPSFLLHSPAGRRVAVLGVEATDSPSAATHAEKLKAAGLVDDVIAGDASHLGVLEVRKRLTGWMLRSA